jgi:hypothetical protein
LSESSEERHSVTLTGIIIISSSSSSFSISINIATLVGIAILKCDAVFSLPHQITHPSIDNIWNTQRWSTPFRAPDWGFGRTCHSPDTGFSVSGGSGRCPPWPHLSLGKVVGHTNTSLRVQIRKWIFPLTFTSRKITESLFFAFVVAYLQAINVIHVGTSERMNSACRLTLTSVLCTKQQESVFNVNVNTAFFIA